MVSDWRHGQEFEDKKKSCMNLLSRQKGSTAILSLTRLSSHYITLYSPAQNRLFHPSPSEYLIRLNPSLLAIHTSIDALNGSRSLRPVAGPTKCTIVRTCFSNRNFFLDVSVGNIQINTEWVMENAHCLS